MRLKGQVAVITGAANGIGRGIALKFAEQGAKIVACDISFMAAENVCDAIEDDFGKNIAIPVKADVTQKDEVDALFKEAVAAFGKVDILVSNAGVKKDAPIHSMTEEKWDYVLSTQLKGCFNCVQQAQDLMVKQNTGRIVIVSGPTASAPWKSNQANFEAANAGLTGLTKALSVELGKHNITVNCVAPEYILTGMTRETIKKEGMFVDDYKRIILSHIPLRRLGTAEDVANSVLFFASKEAGYVSGQVLTVRGGP